MAADGHDFGPHLPGVFDFTILFEQSILSLMPTALFILVAPLRIVRLYNRADRVQSGVLLWSKIAVVGIFTCLQIALVTLWSVSSAPKAKTSIAEPAVAVVEAVVIGAVSYLEHVKSTKPSVLLNCYLILTIILDIALTRTFWIRPGIEAIAGVFTASLVCKAALLFLEETPKTPIAGGEPLCRETSSGVINRSVFWWLNRLFLLGSRRVLSIDDLGEVNEKIESGRLLETLEERWTKDPKQSPLALLSCTFLTFKWQFFRGIIPRLLHSGFNYAQPFVIQSIILYIGSPKDPWSPQIASGLIGATVLIYVGRAITMAWYKHMSYQLVTMYRGGLVSLIYKKTLDVRTSSVRENAPVSLMSTDMNIIASAGETMHNFWSSFLELPVGIYLLYRQVGLTSLFILIPTLVTTVLSGLVAPGMEPATVAWNAAIQERVGYTSNMLSQVKGIKMMGLTEYFHKLVRGLRIEEIRVSERMRWLLVQIITLASMSYELAPMVVILGAIYWTKADEGLSIAEAFTSLSIISLATQPLLVMLTALAQIGGVFGSSMRIQKFLLLEEQKDTRTTAEKSSASGAPKPAPEAGFGSGITGDAALELKQLVPAGVSGSDLEPAIVIRGATFKAEGGTELLHGIDLEVKQGTVTMIVSRVGGGKSSLLRAIIGDLTPESGTVTVAAGSSAYCDQVTWLRNATIRDNVLGQTPLDEVWLTEVVQACALDQDFAALSDGDATVVGSGGVALSGGQRQRIALARAVYSRKSLVVLDDVFSGLDNKTSRATFQRLLGDNGLLRRSKTTVVLSTSNPNLLPAADNITMLEAGRIVRNQVSYNSCDSSEWGALAEDSPRDESEHESTPLGKDHIHPPTMEESLPKEEDLARQTGDTDCYRIYLETLGWGFVACVVCLQILAAGLEVMPRVWLKLWTENGSGSRDPGYTAGYIAFGTSTMLLGAFSLGLFIIVGMPKSSNRLHERLLRTVCRAPLYFFTTTDSGITLNRFSQDMSLVDQDLPLTFYMTSLLIFRAVAQTGVVASGASYVAAFIPLIVVTLYFVQKYYLRTSRQMRFLDIEMKAPLYTHFTETLAGASTVRAFGWSDAFLDENTRRLNASQKPFYLMFCIQRWLQVVLDLFVAGLALVLVALALRVTGATSQGAIGLALVNLLEFSQTLTLVIDQWTQLETSLGAIARLKWFSKNTPNESREAEKEMPPGDWPARGAIEFENVDASYSPTTSLVLNEISLRIEPGQKVGVCGRSGSGKSSLVLALLRLLEVRSGTIRIDGLDLSKLPRQYIRSHLTSVPQEPVNIIGTVRDNLDPESNVQSDDLLIDVLRKASIWSVIEPRGGLDAKGADLGLSAGQQQLFCIARAMLSRHKVVLLDEATSSVDRATDEEIRRLVREEMEGKTVVEVAHRLEILKDFDLVVVMGEGKILEVGNPAILLSRESEFKSLWKSQGL